ncbi:MAG: DUF192 domain-containing protein [Candidatus Microgenomates bacterium]|jgi:hypothetical protein
MVKQILLPILAVVAFIIIVGVFTQKSGFLNLKSLSVTQPTPTPMKTLTIGSKTITVQVADTEAKRQQGLSGISSLDASSGMLFIFDTKGVVTTFWMKGMLIPLDMIWIANGKIIRIDKNIPVPSPNTPDNNLKRYSAGKPIDYVLEVNAGFSDKNNIKVGDSVGI